MNRICFLTRNYRGLANAGNKAKTDNEDTLTDLGATNLGLTRSFHRNKVVTFFLDLAGVIRCCLRLKRGDVLFLQYPVKKYFAFLCRMSHLKGAKVATVIHDLGSFRRKKLTVAKEICRLSHADYIIGSNEVMRQWLTDHGLQRPTGSLGLFDYRSEAMPCPHSPYRQGHARVVYAGSLAMRKNAFILKLQEQEAQAKSYELHLYGNRDGLPGLKDSSAMVIHGFAPADAFVAHVDADFGLVWDGDALDDCTGNFGEYLRYNSPHKASFYLRAGLPVITWSHSAIAPIILREGIGMVIHSLDDMNHQLASLTPEAYQEMKGNTDRILQKLQRGGFLSEALIEMSRHLPSPLSPQQP